MSNKSKLRYHGVTRASIILALFVLGFVAPDVYDLSSHLSKAGAIISQIAGAYFAETVTPEELQQTYDDENRLLRVLVVPGHSNESWGTEFRGVKEAEVNLELGEHLYRYLKSDASFDAMITRAGDGEHTPWFANYLTDNELSIRAYMVQKRAEFTIAEAQGHIKRHTQVSHNEAPSQTALELYGINKYASENGVDIVIHIHFNDYPGRKHGIAGKHSGFSMYVPEDTLPNARASRELALSLRDRLSRHFATSDLPLEEGVVIPDQELIAVGSNASQRRAAILIEYGYIYENQFHDRALRGPILEELALQTYWGILDHFEKGSAMNQSRLGVLLPYFWDDSAIDMEASSRSVLSLQGALSSEGLYPPPGKSRNDCPISGTFGPCTKESLALFQERFAEMLLVPEGLARGSGTLGPKTKSILNELYGDPESLL